MGVLNYRLEKNLPSVDGLKGLLTTADIPVRDHDQLYQQLHPKSFLTKLFGNVFKGFHEATIQFPPTALYQQGTDDWIS